VVYVFFYAWHQKLHRQNVIWAMAHAQRAGAGPDYVAAWFQPSAEKTFDFDQRPAAQTMSYMKRHGHGREKRRCKDCGGSGICKHNHVKFTCKQSNEAGGGGICIHNRYAQEFC